MRFSVITFTVLTVVLLPACGSDSSTDITSTNDPASANSSGAAITTVPTPTSPQTAMFTTTEAVEGGAFAPGEEWYAYQEWVAELAQIFLVRPDGSGRHPLAQGVAAGHQTNPDWSPDGDRLVFAAGNGSTDDLWVIGADGSDARTVLACVDPCVALDDPAWSPDGGSILFSRQAISPSGDVVIGSLELIDLASGDVSVILTAPEPDFIAGPRFSPDGSRVVLEWVHTDGSAPFEHVTGVELAVIDLDAPNPTMQPITDAAMFAATADWSPDGSTIVFSALAAPEASAPELFSIRPDGSGLTQLTAITDGGGSAEHPDFRGDRGSVVFAGSFDGAGRLLIEVDIATGEISAAVGAGYVAGAHPRSRPVE